MVVCMSDPRDVQAEHLWHDIMARNFWLAEVANFTRFSNPEIACHPVAHCIVLSISAKLATLDGQCMTGRQLERALDWRGLFRRACECSSRRCVKFPDLGRIR